MPTLHAIVEEPAASTYLASDVRRSAPSCDSDVAPKRTAPEAGDVVVREARQGRSRVYILRTAPGPDQYLLRTFEEAVTHAVTFAKRQQMRAWLTDEGNRFVLIDDFRVVVSI